ncbi:MAG TPA: PAS domain S-box protein [Candidatus Angelobacter sp.]|jgi:PAS domain S-box-containing protein|nr:PAS domain S-box protein [Candidatus Angelobacter sp.]
MSANVSLPREPAIFSPAIDQGNIDSHGHTVQFYRDAAFLLEGLGRFIGSALGAGDSSVVIATKAHRDGLVQHLKARGLDLSLAANQGRYLSLDAAETLAKFMRNGSLDASRFAEVVGSVLARARAAAQGEQSRVAAFGEMVALLWAEGKTEAAIRLEQLWNDLAQSHSFHLHCAYPIAAFGQVADGDLIEKVCAAHSRVIPLESYTSLASDEDRLLSVVLLQQKAIALETEIAERKRIQHSLQLREAELTDFLENALIGMHWVAADGSILWANKAEMELLGYSREEFIGHHVREFHADPDVIEDILQRLSRSEELHTYEARLRCKDGSIRYVRIDSNVFMQDGKFVHSRCFTVDITEQQKAQEARLKLAAIVESSDDAIASKNLNGVITSWNGSAERMFGYRAEEIIGQPVTLIIPPELQDDERMILGKIRRGEKIDHFETVRLTKSGERIDVSLTVSPMKDDSGKVMGAAKIMRNITETKKIERALHLTERLASVGRLAATVAHEINNPLEAVTNLLFLAKRDLSDGSKAGRHLELANRELDRVAHIARQTLGFYRDTSAPVPLDVSQILDDLLFLYESKLEGRGIKLVKQYDSSVEIQALAGEVRQVFSNLISNSIDAMPFGGSLIVRISESREWNNSNLPGVRITVADTGDGIQPQHIKHIFEPFFTTKTDVGTGLGLWITRGIIQKHGGTIQVHSRTEAGRSGTAISVFLPQVAAHVEEKTTLLSSEIRGLVNAKTILTGSGAD